MIFIMTQTDFLVHVHASIVSKHCQPHEFEYVMQALHTFIYTASDGTETGVYLRRGDHSNEIGY